MRQAGSAKFAALHAIRIAMRHALVAASALMLISCSTRTELTRHRVQAEDLKCAQQQNIALGLSARGKMSVSSEAQKAHGRFSYRYLNNRYQLGVWGALGRGHWQLSGTPDYAVLTDSEGERHTGPDATVLLDDLYGWALPLPALPFWIVGCVAPETAIRDARLDDEGRLVFLQQGGWELTFAGFASKADSELPGKIIATDGETRLKLVIKSRAFDRALESD